MKRTFLAAVLLLAVPLRAPAEPTRAQHLPAIRLTIRTHHATRRFLVELAQTWEEQEIGLMFRTALADDRGMLFPMEPPRPASFWMKNTLIPLDILFIRRDGTVSSIAANATPLSLATLNSTEPVGAVLELAGGEARRAGILPGDRVRWRKG